MYKKGRTFINLLTDTVVLHVSHGIQIIPVLTIFGLILENLLKIPEIHVVWQVFNKLNV